MRTRRRRTPDSPESATPKGVSQVRQRCRHVKGSTARAVPYDGLTPRKLGQETDAHGRTLRSGLTERGDVNGVASLQRTISIEPRTCVSLRWLGRSLFLLPRAVRSSRSCHVYQLTVQLARRDVGRARGRRRVNHPARRISLRSASAFLNSTRTCDHASALQRVCSITRRTRLMRSRGCRRRASV
jgi:hypothetical protein